MKAQWELNLEAYEEYNKKIGGEPIGLFVPDDYPNGVEEIGRVIPVFKKCIEVGKMWQDLLRYVKPDDDWEL